MPPKSSAKKKGEGKQAATAAEGFEDHSDHEDPSVSSKESDSAAESARILDEAMDLMTSDKQKRTLLKVVTKFQNLTPVQIENAALLIQHYRHYSEYEETIFKLIGGAPAASEFLEEPPQLSATEVTQLTSFRKSLTMNEPKQNNQLKKILKSSSREPEEVLFHLQHLILKSKNTSTASGTTLLVQLMPLGKPRLVSSRLFPSSLHLLLLKYSADLTKVLIREHRGVHPGPAIRRLSRPKST